MEDELNEYTHSRTGNYTVSMLTPENFDLLLLSFSNKEIKYLYRKMEAFNFASEFNAKLPKSITEKQEKIFYGYILPTLRKAYINIIEEEKKDILNQCPKILRILYNIKNNNIAYLLDIAINNAHIRFRDSIDDFKNLDKEMIDEIEERVIKELIHNNNVTNLRLAEINDSHCIITIKFKE